MSRLLDAEEGADYCNMKMRRFQELLQYQIIPSTLFKGKHRVKQEDCDRYLLEKQQNQEESNSD